jgi:hypothetical protein
MSVRLLTLTVDMPLHEIRHELRYTLAKLRLRTWAAGHVPTFAGLLKDVDDLQTERTGLRDALDDAQAAVDEVDAHLDAFVEATVAPARAAVNKDTDAPLWRRLFGGQRPSDFVRPTLGQELENMRSWPDLLKAAPTKELTDRAAPCAALIKAADAAIAARTRAQAALDVFQASKLGALVDRINAERARLIGEAERLRHDGTIPDLEADGLFQKSPRRQARPDSLADTQAAIADCERELARLKARAAEQQAELQALAAARAARQSDEEALRLLRSQQAETARKIAELEAKHK